MHSRRDLLAGLAAAGTTGLVSGCIGNGGFGSGGNGSVDRAVDPTVVVVEHDQYGEILVDDEGMTLYQFVNDEPNETSCLENCLERWPALVVDSEATGGDDVTAEIDTLRRPDGRRQVTAAEWPLYNYIEDEAPGDVEGQGVNDAWFVVDPGGKPVDSGDEPASGDYNSSGYGGYDQNSSNQTDETPPAE